MRRLRTTTGAFLRRDARIALSYKAPFLFDVVGAIFVVFEFSYLAKIVPPEGPTGDYLTFVVTGLVAVTVLITGMTVIASNVRQEQVQGTLEASLSAGLSPGAWSVGVAAYPIVSGVLRATTYTFIAYFLGARAPAANWSLALAALLLGAVSFVSIGIAAVGLVLALRQAAGAVGWVVGVATILAGVLFPVDLLPPILRFLSGLSAATWALRTVRLAVIEGASWAEGWRSVGVLCLMAVAYWALGQAALALGLRHARKTGSLAAY